MSGVQGSAHHGVAGQTGPVPQGPQPGDRRPEGCQGGLRESTGGQGTTTASGRKKCIQFVSFVYTNVFDKNMSLNIDHAIFHNIRKYKNVMFVCLESSPGDCLREPQH